MKHYLKQNLLQRRTFYDATNVSDVVFKLYGNILKKKYKLPYKNKLTTVLDFGCGQGATVNFFNQCGFDAYGVDISKIDIEKAKTRYPHIAHKFTLCKPDSFNAPMTKYTENKKISLISCIRSIYYFDKEDFNTLLVNFKKSLKTKGLLYVSLISSSHTIYKFAKETKYQWLKKIEFKSNNVNLRNYFCFFTESKEDICKKFQIFKKIFVGSHHTELDKTNMNGHHYLFLCQKK